MLQQTVKYFSLDSFRQASSGKKITCFYPWSNFRQLFLAAFLDNARDGILYYRINEEQVALDRWLGDLLEEFRSVLGDFGSNLSPVLTQGNPAALGEALAADLGALRDEPLLLFIDELDRVKLDADFNQFFDSLVGSLPDHVQITLSSRLITQPFLHDRVARGEVAVLGTDQRKDDLFFTLEETPKPQLEVHAFGRGHVLVNGQLITNWDGALPRNLFFFFVDNPLVTRDEVFEAFWPDLSVKDATNVFHVTKRKITERISMKISDHDNYELTQYINAFYMPSDKVVRHYDAGDFEEAVDQALVATSEKQEFALLMRAIDTYRDSFLQAVDMKWVTKRRDTLRLKYAQALIGMGRIYQRRGDDQRTLGFFTRALKETPEREDIHREVMRLYQQMSLTDDAIRQYRQLEKLLQDSLKIAPARETRELFEQIERARG